MACQIHKGQVHSAREDVDILNLLLDHGAAKHVLALAGSDRQTAIHFVAQTGNSDIMGVLFDRLDPGQVQLCVNMQTASGWSPLCTASAQSHLQCVKLILKVCQNRQQSSPLLYNIDIWPARNSLLTQRETNHYIHNSLRKLVSLALPCLALDRTISYRPFCTASAICCMLSI